MNKNELITAIAAESGLTKTKTSEVINAFVSVVTDTLANGDEISISGFGKFDVSERAARTGRNPQTGEDIEIPEKKAPHFKPSKVLKEIVNA